MASSRWSKFPYDQKPYVYAGNSQKMGGTAGLERLADFRGEPGTVAGENGLIHPSLVWGKGLGEKTIYSVANLFR